MDWYRWHFQLYKADTMHLDPYQDGCYRRLIDHIMETRNPLPDNDAALARIVGTSLTEWKEKAADTVRPLLKVGRDGLLHQKRADMELNWQDNQTKKKSEAGKKGAENRFKINNEINDLNSTASTPAQLLLNRGEDRRRKSVLKEKKLPSETQNKHLSQPHDVGSEEKTLPTAFAVSGGGVLNFDQLFERFWNMYPKVRDRGHKGKAKAQLKKLLLSGRDYVTIGKGITRYAAYCTETEENNSDMFRWLRDAHFERDYILPNKQKGKINGTARPLTRSEQLDLATEQALRDLDGDDEEGEKQENLRIGPPIV